jgi:hypothetical protein
VKMHRREAMSVLEIDIEIETPSKEVAAILKKGAGLARFERAR